MSTTIRIDRKELLDNLTLSGDELYKTLSGLGIINATLGCHKQLVDGVVESILEDDYFLDKIVVQLNGGESAIRIVDLGSGQGDCVFALNQCFAKRNILLHYTGIDGNPNCTKIARGKATDLNIRFITDDIFAPDFTIPENDIITSSQFIHHFDDEQLINFLKTCKLISTRKIIFNDIWRSKTAIFTFKWLRHLFPISKTAKDDFLTAAQRAFTIDEMHQIMKASGITNYKIIKKPWFRMLVKINLNS